MELLLVGRVGRVGRDGRVGRVRPTQPTRPTRPTRPTCHFAGVVFGPLTDVAVASFRFNHLTDSKGVIGLSHDDAGGRIQ